MWERTEPFTVRRLDDGREFQLIRGYRRAVDKLADVASPDGRGVYTPDEESFFFVGEDDRPMRIVAAK
jgi:hypothetical protein